MSKQYRRWWIGVALTACMAVVPMAFGAAGPNPNMPEPALAAAVDKWVKEEAELLDTPGILAEKAAGFRDELTAAFVANKAPSAYRQDMAKSCGKYLGDLVLHSKSPQTTINALIVLYIVDHFDTDGAFRSALGNKASTVEIRYWAAKGLAHIMPQFKGEISPGNIFAETTRKGGYLLVEKDPLVRAELANVVGQIDPVKFPGGLAALTQAIVMTNDELTSLKNPAPVTKAYTDCAATIMDNMTLLIKAGATPVPEALKAATAELRTAMEHVKTHNEKSPEDAAVLEGLRLQYQSYKKLVAASPGMKGVSLPQEPAANMDPVKDPPKLFTAIDVATSNVTKALSPKPAPAAAP